MNWDEWEDKVRQCKLCPLCTDKKVLGDGPKECSLVLVGESPGENEEKFGKPFVGKAGRLQNDILKNVSLRRESIYVTNVVKCHPPGNKTTEEAMNVCRNWLYKELEFVKPKIIVPVGGFAIKAFGLFDAISKCRGQWFDWNGILIFPTYHPAYLLYKNDGGQSKKIVESDWLRVRERLLDGKLREDVSAVKIKDGDGNQYVIGKGGESIADVWANL